MNYFLGIDGGGTKSKAVLIDAKLNIITDCLGGPTNFLISGTEIVCDTLLDLINNCLKKGDVTLDTIKSIVLGTTGAGRKSDAEILKNAFLEATSQKNIKINSFNVVSDARIALEGAFSGNPGSILIAGTGSIMFGKDESGQIHRVGGFGRYIGDDGSGYGIGRKGLIAVAKNLDGRGPDTILTKYIADQFNIRTPNELITEIYTNNFDIAKVAPLVIKAAEVEDEICRKILDDESDELIQHLSAMRKKIRTEKLFLCLVGSLITKENIYSQMFNEKVNRLFPDVKIKEADMPPEMGAALMAKNYF